MNNRILLNVIPNIKNLAEKFNSINILETGCIRGLNEINAHSTKHICEFIRDQQLFDEISFYSFDLKTTICRNFLTDLNLIHYVNLQEIDSREGIKNIESPIHFAFLDSANNSELTIEEFEILKPKMCNGGLVIIDDTNINGIDKIKGKFVYSNYKNKYEMEFLPYNQLLIRF